MENSQKYLKGESYYNDLYDLGTIKKCLWLLDFWRKEYKKRIGDKTAPEKDKARAFSLGLNLDLYFTKGERYRHKSAFVEEFMEKDKGRDELLANAAPPQNILCPTCKSIMESDRKHLDFGIDKPDRVQFFFVCGFCKKRKIIYDNGEEYIPKPRLCPKCGGELKTSCSRKGKVFIWKTSCLSCEFKETEIEDFGRKEFERQKQEKEDRKLLRKYRSEFCLTDEKGQEYTAEVERLKDMVKLMKEMERKESDPNYQKAMSLKRLKIAEVEKLLSEALEKESYIKFATEKPEIGRHVVVPFSVQDADAKRIVYDSAQLAKRIIRQALEETSWRLMSEGVSYKLGYLYGSLKGYETEEDLMKLIK